MIWRSCLCILDHTFYIYMLRRLWQRRAFVIVKARTLLTGIGTAPVEYCLLKRPGRVVLAIPCKYPTW